jgi:hypothetical protein
LNTTYPHHAKLPQSDDYKFFPHNLFSVNTNEQKSFLFSPRFNKVYHVIRFSIFEYFNNYSIDNNYEKLLL